MDKLGGLVNDNFNPTLLKTVFQSCQAIQRTTAAHLPPLTWRDVGVAWWVDAHTGNCAVPRHKVSKQACKRKQIYFATTAIYMLSAPPGSHWPSSTSKRWCTAPIAPHALISEDASLFENKSNNPVQEGKRVLPRSAEVMTWLDMCNWAMAAYDASTRLQVASILGIKVGDVAGAVYSSLMVGINQPQQSSLLFHDDVLNVHCSQSAPSSAPQSMPPGEQDFLPACTTHLASILVRRMHGYQGWAILSFEPNAH
eukprot:scaffold45447_cov17-Tisochrysis_lutea.AAC.1